MEAETENSRSGGKKPAKLPRRRKKATFAKIRDQMEFYFSDANLHKDRFLKKSIEETTDGYISLDVFLQFNKIKSLTKDASVIAGALDKNSELLQLNPERTHVKRVTPIEEPKNVDERTVYVECLPHHVDHEWMKKLFSACGKVVYVSLPKYPSTGDPKGFGFVEFETIEGAQEACKELNNPPAEDVSQKAGMFPKSSHQMDSIRKKIPKEEIDKTVEQAKDDALEDDQDKNESNNTSEVQGKDSEKNKETKGKRRRTNSESDSAANSDASPTKRKKSDVSFDLPSEEQKSADDKTPGAKKRSRKRKSRGKTVESEESKGESDLDKSGEVAPEKKQRLSEKAEKAENDESQSIETDISVKGSTAADGKQSKGNTAKKKKRFRRKKDKKEKEFPELRVLPKKEWLQLREEYLKLQKSSMALLKKTLGELTDNSKKDSDGVKKSERKMIEFKPDVIVKVTSDDPMKRKNLRNALGEGYKIAYVDVKDDQSDGFIRCEDSESAKKIGAAVVAGYSFTPITGDEEKQYWDKLTLQREEKLNTKCRHKKRGHQKWTEKAQKASVENVERKHVVFDDD